MTDTDTAVEPGFTAYLNLNTRESFLRGWNPNDLMRQAITAPMDYDMDGANVTEQLERVFEMLNVGECDIALKYRVLGNRSLSVGDVVTLNGYGTFSVERSGWTSINPDNVKTDGSSLLVVGHRVPDEITDEAEDEPEPERQREVVCECGYFQFAHLQSDCDEGFTIPLPSVREEGVTK